MNSADERRFMHRALELARRGEGYVEPNPMVGAVVVSGDHVVGEGCHERYGGPHAEAEALSAAGDAARGATLYVTLEPCCHTGKTLPCTEAILAAGIARVVVAVEDPFALVAGGGIQRLREAGVPCDVGLCADEAQALLAPYLKLTTIGRPWVIAKWAMTLDGKTATHTGSSQWISTEASRQVVHALRGRVDAILVGAGTVRTDDPLLTARPPGPRTATRIVLGDVPASSRLAATAGEIPLWVVRASEPTGNRYDWLEKAGGELLVFRPQVRPTPIEQLLDELGRRRMTNLLVEGGSQVLGNFFDLEAIDEVHAFVAPKLIGGGAAPSPIAGQGLARIDSARLLDGWKAESLDGDLYIAGRVKAGRTWVK